MQKLPKSERYVASFLYRLIYDTFQFRGLLPQYTYVGLNSFFFPLKANV